MTPLAFLSPLRVLAFAALVAVGLVPVARAIAAAPAIEWQSVEVAPTAPAVLWWTSERELHLRTWDGSDVVIAHVTADERLSLAQESIEP